MKPVEILKECLFRRFYTLSSPQFFVGIFAKLLVNQVFFRACKRNRVSHEMTPGQHPNTMGSQSFRQYKPPLTLVFWDAPEMT